MNADDDKKRRTLDYETIGVTSGIRSLSGRGWILMTLILILLASFGIALYREFIEVRNY